MTRHLRLVASNSTTTMITPAPTSTPVSGSAHRLAAQVVHLARTWAAELDASRVIPEVDTSIGLAQRDLMDAVHDLEYYEMGRDARRFGSPPA